MTFNNKKNIKHLNNESGAMALLGAMVITIAITTILSTFYIYSVNQAKYHGRIKAAYQTMNVMESLASAYRKAYDMGRSAQLTGNCPAGTLQSPATGQIEFCFSTTPVCFHREDRSPDQEQFCFNFSQQQASYQERINEAYAMLNNSLDNSLDNIKTQSNNKLWLARLNGFYESPALKQDMKEVFASRSNSLRPKLLDWLSFSHNNAYARQQGGHQPGGRNGANEVFISLAEILCSVNGQIVSNPHPSCANCTTNSCLPVRPSLASAGGPVAAVDNRSPIQNFMIVRQP